ncbi:DNA-binding response regulator, OmpR family, contains REC and winged-helix (wHTH) domain [Pseudonocardia thermophila]|uniref:DNA-binding response regulator, OmpR family, contains REC and winged-helix (WHTH) domain n=1 Tax=Pseudonocardia thermophila TaxID=1848 RepID=A0A1M6TFL0_PSETH|nr:response regulator transcription factor [Pseudonocardia thermophila]SHK55805.1 DNA-binding response regulator, OmpR family, contains REC and winged-helix (wHTH) domain [Pseudonocardia thermophila]
MARILLVEDDPTIGKVLETSLASSGNQTTWVTYGREALDQAAAGPIDLVLLDLGLPDMDGVDVCRRLRAEQPGCVIVMLTARQEEMDVVVGLEAGADDYLTKPIRLGELLARVRAHLRRGGANTVPSGVMTFGALTVDTGSRRVLVGGREVPLRAKEFDLLARLAAEPGVALSRATLMADVWDDHWMGSTKTLDVHVAALRRKLEQAAGPVTAPLPRIVTLRGFGYRLEETPATG